MYLLNVCVIEVCNLEVIRGHFSIIFDFWVCALLTLNRVRFSLLWIVAAEIRHDAIVRHEAGIVAQWSRI